MAKTAGWTIERVKMLRELWHKDLSLDVIADAISALPPDDIPFDRHDCYSKGTRLRLHLKSPQNDEIAPVPNSPIEATGDTEHKRRAKIPPITTAYESVRRRRRLLKGRQRHAKRQLERQIAENPGVSEGVWRDIPGWEGLYQVSDLGRIRNALGLVLSPGISDLGYERVGLWRPEAKGAKEMRVHRAVALAFIPNPDGKRNVNHIDTDRRNNRVSNLEWASNTENANHTKRLAIDAYRHAAQVIEEIAQDFQDHKTRAILRRCQSRVLACSTPLERSKVRAWGAPSKRTFDDKADAEIHGAIEDIVAQLQSQFNDPREEVLYRVWAFLENDDHLKRIAP